jgi:AcrR family transcriptional regulator
LQAAILRFADLGYHATTTRDIAERAGMSPAAVYVHFDSKLELLQTISRIGHESARGCLISAIAHGETPTDRVASAIHAFARWHAENQTLARVVQYEYQALPPAGRRKIKSMRREMQAMLQAEIGAGIRSGEFVNVDPDDAALAILSLCVDIARWYDPRGRRKPAELGNIYAALGLKMLGSVRVSAPG